MEVITTRINVANLRDVLNAAEALQEAGETEKAHEALRALARSIDEQLPRRYHRAPLPSPIPDKPTRRGG